MGRHLTKTVFLVLMLHFLISSSSAFCKAMDFTVQTANSSIEEPYYGNTSTLEPMAESLIKSQKLVRAMILVQLIYLVVTRTLFAIVLHDFTRWRNQQQMQALIEREARRLIRNM